MTKMSIQNEITCYVEKIPPKSPIYNSMYEYYTFKATKKKIILLISLPVDKDEKRNDI